ncbi:sepiapterin reductase b [Syngnathoides biaculeatus]|uniref:sepiapterin reductase b n=1 Tax=Syngnathoides biaculeatus TaxID=300417 RepID=UPI002ADDC979|nr:sepiapterin reductase b [Syngnathoides biaculeatus]
MSEVLQASGSTLGRCMCIITGASKGFGRALALLVSTAVRSLGRRRDEVVRFLQASRRLKPGSVLVLVARSGLLLQELKEELLQGLQDVQDLSVCCTPADLSTKGGVEDAVEVARQQGLEGIEHVLLVNNAASLGDISPFESFTELDEVNSYLALNVSSALALTAGVLRAFRPRAGLRWSVVNCSSALALRPLPSRVPYCTAKAAREMMFRVLAAENPNVKVLNYSPGPMDTEMQEQIQKLTGIQNHLYPCQESASKLLSVLLKDDFATGSHLDFFDL